MDLPRLFAKSIYSPDFYRELEHHRLSFSFRYFFLLAGTLAFVAAVFYGIAVFPSMYNWLKDFGPAVSSAYPEELRIDIRNGEVVTNVGNPYEIKMPTAIVPERVNEVENLLVIDTMNDFSVDRFDRYDTLAWLLKDSIAFRDGENGVRIQTLREVPSFTLDRNAVLSLVYQIEGVTRIGFPFLVLFGVMLLTVGFFLFLNLNLAILLFWALLIMLLAAFWQKPASYGKAYQIGIHASSLSVALSAATLFFPSYYHIRFLPTLLTLLIVWVNLRPQVARNKREVV